MGGCTSWSPMGFGRVVPVKWHPHERLDLRIGSSALHSNEMNNGIYFSCQWSLFQCYGGLVCIFSNLLQVQFPFSAIANISRFLPLMSLPLLLPPPSVCHPPPTRPPAELLLQTQLRGRLDPAETPHRCECDPVETAPSPSTVAISL